MKTATPFDLALRGVEVCATLAGMAAVCQEDARRAEAARDLESASQHELNAYDLLVALESIAERQGQV